uniref:RNase H type-1 domain-containing protein n=1 Tax=Oryza meridionalis TaxID=40149 RepID=A0A0E0BXL0_9ORYZ
MSDLLSVQIAIVVDSYAVLDGSRSSNTEMTQQTIGRVPHDLVTTRRKDICGTHLSFTQKRYNGQEEQVRGRGYSPAPGIGDAARAPRWSGCAAAAQPRSGLHPRRQRGVGIRILRLRAYLSASTRTWRKLEEGWMKLNFDGSSKHSTGIASISAVLRRGLELANGWRLIWAEGDSKVMVDVVRDRADMQSEKDLRLCREIATLLPQLDDMAVFHVCRGGNKVAELGHRVPTWVAGASYVALAAVSIVVVPLPYPQLQHCHARCAVVRHWPKGKRKREIRREEGEEGLERG